MLSAPQYSLNKPLRLSSNSCICTEIRLHTSGLYLVVKSTFNHSAIIMRLLRAVGCNQRKVGWIIVHTKLFLFFICKCVPVCVGLAHEITRKCGKVHRVWILSQATVYVSHWVCQERWRSGLYHMTQGGYVCSLIMAEKIPVHSSAFSKPDDEDQKWHNLLGPRYFPQALCCQVLWFIGSISRIKSQRWLSFHLQCHGNV